MSALNEGDSTDVLEDINQSGVLGKSERQLALLEYLLKETVAGRGASIKPYDIAVDVFGRGKDFDQSIDSIVRTEMHRLRQHLQAYNNADHKYRIELPKSSYQPTVVARSSSKPGTDSLSIGKKVVVSALLSLLAVFVSYAASQWLGRYEVKPSTFAVRLKIVEPDSQDPEINRIHLAFNSHLHGDLLSFPFVELISTEDYDYALSYVVHKYSNASFHLRVSFHSKDGRLVWSTAKSLNNGVADSDSEEAVFKIVRASLVLPGHLLFTDFLNNKEIDSWRKDMLQCADAALHLSTDGIRQAAYPENELLNCLQVESVESARDKSDIHALRAMLYINAFRGYNRLEADEPFQRALEETEKAHQLLPFSYLSLSARLIVERERVPTRNLQAIKDVLNNIEIYLPNHYGLMTDRAVTHGFILGNWEKSDQLSREYLADLAEKEDAPQELHIIQVSKALVEGNPGEAARWADLTPDSNVVIYKAIRAAAYCQAGQEDKLKTLRKDFADAGLSSAKDYISFIKARRYEPGIQKALLTIARPEQRCSIFR